MTRGATHAPPTPPEPGQGPLVGRLKWRDAVEASRAVPQLGPTTPSTKRTSEACAEAANVRVYYYPTIIMQYYSTAILLYYDTKYVPLLLYSTTAVLL